MKRTRLAGSSLALSLLATAALAPPQADAAGPYEIHAILPLTGGAAFLGTGEQKSLQLGEKAVNESGGIQGRPVKFVFQDDQSSPQLGVQLSGDLIARKPAVMIGSSLVAICRAMAPLMKDGPVDYCLSPGIHPEAGYVFTASVSTLDLANALIRYFRLKGWTRIGLMFSTDATGQDAENGIKGVLALPENKAMKIVATAHFNTTDVSVAAQIEDVKAAHPQCFIAWSTGAPIATIFRGITAAGLDVPTATTDGNMTYAQMTQYAKFLPKQLYIPAAEWVVRDGALLSPPVAKAHEEFYRLFDEAGIKPDISAELGWDAGMIIVDALRKLGPDAKAPQVRDFIAHLKGYAGVNGIYDFTKVPQRGLDVSNAVVTRWSPKAKTWQVVSRPTGVPLP
ncbi:MAG TPA: ABC transporter substrate-binding protein [Stellaceae bacterium]|nr:ABC transporter substrate-binding protein [Stellaceae bacterium]